MSLLNVYLAFAMLNHKSFIKLLIIHFAGTGSKAGSMLIKVYKSFIKLLIMHFAGTGSKVGTMLIKVNKSFITVNDYLLYIIKFDKR